MSRPPRYILRCQCPDTLGIVARVSGFLADRHLSIIESADFGDPETGQFFIRVEFSPTENGFRRRAFETDFASLAQDLQMEWSLTDADIAPRVLILVSKFDHCLHDLLYRKRKGDLHMEVPAIVSNHMESAWHAERHGIPYRHIPATPQTRDDAEAEIKRIVEETKADLVVLARYMQILSDDMCAYLSGRCINIHHSFLPSFKGARPYHQAYSRGVKLIGATAHYVTTDLDEGPIIAQDVARVDHRTQPDRMVAMGRDIEARVLADAVRAHIEGRIFLNRTKTVVFD